MKPKYLKPAYIISDIFSSQLAWTLFFFFRKAVIEKKIFGPELIISADKQLITGLIVIPLFWLLLNFFTGFYNNPLRKSRLSDFGQTFIITLFGTLILFFALILDDTIGQYTNYYMSVTVLFTLQFFFTYLPRFILTSVTVHKIHKGKIGFNTLLIGGNGRALDIYNKISNQVKSAGNKFVGFLSISENQESSLPEDIENMGTVKNLPHILKSEEIEEVIIALEPNESEKIENIISDLRNTRIIIKAIPGMHDTLLGRIKMSTIFSTPLILLNTDSMPVWQYSIKRVIDYLGAITALVVMLPVSIVLGVMIKLSGPGPIIYRQERVGRDGKKFLIYKFRSMHHAAEISGPVLSTKDDQRVSGIGKFMRRHRLDEIPNFINVLKGEMSIVGPRPERQYYIDEIIKVAPRYKNLLKVKPGITSWGQVKYGYASNVSEMVERLEYDLIYLDNMSLYVDLKIIIYTLLTILRGHGV